MRVCVVASETEPTDIVAVGALWYDIPNKVWRRCTSIAPITWAVEDLPVSEHSHEGLDHLPDIITLLEHGITGSKTIGGYKFTFNHGVLTGFEEV